MKFTISILGEWTENGCLRIIDRKKHIFKTQQGEYIAPERLESIYGKCNLIDQVFIYGNSLRSFLVAIIIPNQPGTGIILSKRPCRILSDIFYKNSKN